MMKKKVKKIPKYSLGVDMVSALKGGEISASSKKLQGIGDMANQVAIGGQMIGSALGIELGLNAQIANGVASMLENVPVIGDMLAAPIRLWGGLAGGGGSVDETTGEVTKSSGLTRWLGFGRSDSSLLRKSNRIKNSIQANAQTQNLQADYYNNPNVVIQPNVLAAEGGIMRQPVDALVSKGELIYNPVTKKLSKVPGSKGKPNKKDDVYARLYEGDVVISNSPTMIMANGKTPAQNLEGLIDSDKNMKAKEAIIKKVVNWLESNKTKPQAYAKFDEGYPGFFSYLISNRTRPIDAVISEYMKLYGKTAAETPVTTVPTVSKKKLETTISKKGKVSKPSSGKNTTASRVTTSTVPSPEDTVVRRPVYEEPVKTVTAPVDDTKVYGRDSSVRYDYTTPERKVTPTDLGRTINNDESTDFNWKDNLYRMAVLSQPLWDRAKAETVNYESPIYKYIPTAVDVSSQLRDVDQSYALARYNFANLYPNTGTGMAAGLQAATDRAKQYANIRQYQTNAQNELIGKNVGIYNNWANEYARIMNSVYDKTAANRAAARNINRQNRAAALSNYGQMLKDDKQFAMDTMKLQMMEPMMQYGYENYDDYLKWKKINGYG